MIMDNDWSINNETKQEFIKLLNNRNKKIKIVRKDTQIVKLN